MESSFVFSSLYSPFESSRMVTFFVIDQLSETSEGAMAIINFANTDNPPVVDLNGPFVPGRDSVVQFFEGADPIVVSTG